MSDRVLYSFRRCPYAMRARMALVVSKTRVELREVKLSAKPDAMREVSPKATVPVLVHGDGAILEESIDIMRWALGHTDPEGWLARDDAALIAENDGPFKHALDRYKYPDRHDSDALEHRAEGVKFLRKLEARLEKNPQLCGETRGLADAAIMPFVRQFAATDRDWWAKVDLPRVKAWLAGHMESPLFKTVMQREKPWKPGDAPIALALQS
ncbi:glutathione S-transferase [Aurantiacibacter marinus]|uniref:Glutathione S-transferase n=1 Tax=Aurantiacibacter marinus TaxID=874156 RepID=A0A0H0XT94_9SPHN|nr:glutathione S-transferase [Aurantiacibacter marinus]KLI63510.1 glutathione S-transferase [Aurantiacibacter marinus]